MTMSKRDSELSRSCVHVSPWQMVVLPVAEVSYPASLWEQKVVSVIRPHLEITDSQLELRAIQWRDWPAAEVVARLPVM